MVVNRDHRGVALHKYLSIIKTPKEFANCSPRVSTLGIKKEKRANAESVGEPRSRSWPTLSAFAGSVDGLFQGVATLYPGLALNAFGVPVFVQSLAASSGGFV